jgi:hypothetical protein
LLRIDLSAPARNGFSICAISARIAAVFSSLLPVVRDLGRRRERQVVAPEQAAEERLEREVIALQDRVELVIVAARAAHAEAEDRVAGHVRDVVQDVAPLAPRVALVVLVDAQAQVAGGDGDLGVVGRDLVAGELLLEEAVVGLVVGERADDVVAVRPGVGAVAVLLVAVGFGVADEVQPVAAPALAVARVGEEALDLLLVGVGRRVLLERLELRRRGRQAVEVEAEPAQQRAAVGFRTGDQALGLQFRVDEAVDLVARERIRGGRDDVLHGLERPPGAVGVGDLLLRLSGLRGFGGPGRAGHDPLAEDLDFRGGHLLLGGHLQVGVGPADGAQQGGFFGVAGDEGGSEFAALQEGLAGVDAEAALGLGRLGAVALIAAGGEQRGDFILEVADRVGVALGGGRDGEEQQCGQDARGLDTHAPPCSQGIRLRVRNSSVFLPAYPYVRVPGTVHFPNGFPFRDRRRDDDKHHGPSNGGGRSSGEGRKPWRPSTAICRSSAWPTSFSSSSSTGRPGC